MSPFDLLARNVFIIRRGLPSSPDSVDIHPFSDIHDQLDIGIIVVVGSSRNLITSYQHLIRSNLGWIMLLTSTYRSAIRM